MQTVELVGRLLVSLAVVLVLLWLIARRARRGGRRRIRSGKLIDVLGRQQLSRSASVAVIRVLDRALIVGVSETSVSVLGDLELDAVHAGLADLDGARPAEPAPAAPKASRAPEPRAARAKIDGGDGPARPGVTGRPDGALAGSALSPATWRQTIDALREMTVRRG